MVNVKKGQFLSPEAMQYAVQKVREAGNDEVTITERGTTFGYQDLIVDYRGIPVMRKYAPVIVDITHSLQQPNQSKGVTGGRPELIETIARAAIATGADGIFPASFTFCANANDFPMPLASQSRQYRSIAS